MTTRKRRRSAALALVAGLAGSMLVASYAQAQEESDGDAGTSAEVGGGVAPPTIQCGWALPDADGDWGNFMQYGPDADPLVGGEFVCVDDGSGGAVQGPGVPQIQVLPNAHDEPTEAYVELWGAVSSTNPANTIVYWEVFHPDGSFKVQVDGSLYGYSGDPDKCDGPAGMWDAAEVANEIVTAEARANIIDECKFQQKGLYYGAFGISKHQPYGVYNVVMHSATAGGDEAILEYQIEVLPFHKLEKDFTDINFGPVTPNSHFFQPVQGDFVWDGTDNALNQASSVRNTGNAGVGLSVRFASMCREANSSCTDLKRIDHFDAKFGTALNMMQAIGAESLELALESDLASTAKPAPPGPWHDFDDQPGRVLCPNDVGKIEFSIWTEGIQTGTYSAPGNGIGLLARPLADGSGCPTDVGAPYNAGPTPTSNGHWG